MAEHRPIDVRHADLADGLPEVGGGERDVLLVLWWRGAPLGQLEVNRHGLPPGPLADRIAHVVARPAGERLVGAPFAGFDETSGLPAPTAPAALEPLLAAAEPLTALPAPPAPEPPPVTLAICTRDRPADLDRCLRSVLASDGGWLEVVVVDNRPSTATRAVVDAHPGVRYVAEPRAGLSAARNA